INTLALRSDLVGVTTFRETVDRVRAVVLNALTHQAAPFPQVAEALRSLWSEDGGPRVLFDLEPELFAERALGGLCVRPRLLTTETAKFDLTLALYTRDAALDAVFEYNTDLFDAATIARWADHFLAMLDRIVARPDLPIV